jgi:transcriptional regulator with XRE-family HTH domain
MSAAEDKGRELGSFIAEQRRLAEMSIRKLSDRAGISNPYLSQIERGLRKPSAEILQQIAKALEISSETLYVQAGILDEDKAQVRNEVSAAIRADGSLSEQNKATLLHLYESLREVPPSD